MITFLELVQEEPTQWRRLYPGDFVDREETMEMLREKIKDQEQIMILVRGLKKIYDDKYTQEMKAALKKFMVLCMRLRRLEKGAAI